MNPNYSELLAEIEDIEQLDNSSKVNAAMSYFNERLISSKGRILQVGVGSGNIYSSLLESGLKIEAVEVSSERLAKCGDRCEERDLEAILYEKDLKVDKINHLYETIIVSKEYYLHADDRMQSIQALKAVFNQLRAGGTVFIELSLPPIHLNKTTYQTWKKGAEGITIIEEKKLIETDLLNQYVVSRKTYEKFQKGKLVSSEIYHLTERWYGLKEFKLILERIGFAEVVVSADYRYGEKPSNASQIFTFEAQRPIR
ncbi:class I SAM-dependent methyltransferase [Metabacillus herbersteinensis]|uniref:Class I SAM-dependent methyltransferase n=1 Tax=Metabacillus herbersteinensis TaxID=283816 RepID=A0ABV6GLG1_9BACI